ncbi:hypothetical protein [Plantactinospora sp. CA-290183]|uniref:hypothetical protein n=1 Tax=Plantactinospora sp. CA-290183 TaxID=3240006 RepID=UPI003D8C6DD5
MIVAVAAALATKVAEGMSEGGRAAFAALSRLVRRKLRGDPDAERTLDDALAHSDDQVRAGRLAVLLADVAARDPGFAEELGELWREVRDERVAVVGADNVVNQVTGAVTGTVVQARDVTGGISFGPTAPAGSRRAG